MRGKAAVACAGVAVGIGVGAILAGNAWLTLRHNLRDVKERSTREEPGQALRVDAGEEEPEDDFAFRLPSGAPASLSCEDARRVIAQVRTSLAYAPDKVDPHALATGATDWLDPHGLWSAAPDAPIEAELDARSKAVVAEIEGASGKDCPGARAVGASLANWVASLRGRFEHAREAATDADGGAAAEAIPFDALAYARPATALAEDLGARVGAFERAMGPGSKAYADAARDRFFPALDEEGWTRALLGAVVRAYVPLVDPHGAWAPLDEEESVYEIDLASRPPPRLWDKADRTAIGILLGEGAARPLEPGDLLLSVAGVATAGLPLEQLDQLSFAASDSRAPSGAVVARRGAIVALDLDADADDAGGEPAEEARATLPMERIAFGAGDVIVIAIHDVRDDLGDALARTLGTARRGANARPMQGVVLDLRGDGGGSTDGAIAALGEFLPGAPLFPMKRRDGTLETDRAPDPPPDGRWDGPVATLVDAETASAAEMIAGALAAYRRGPVVGTKTYGKGCAQEYADDDVHAGVLRSTTLLYALPDGSPVQRVGLTPTIAVRFVTSTDDSGPGDREATLAHSAPTWRGPDVRDGRAPSIEQAWPAAGDVGPCTDADVCRALRALGGWSAKALKGTRATVRR